MEIKAEVRKVESLKDFFFVVPDYQREYVWESDNHVARFLQDINDEFNPASKEQTSYFIGSTIIVKRKDGQYDVIDGQQRLTTIIISLCAMRETLSALGFDDSDESESLEETKIELLQIIKDLLYKYSIQQGKKTPRLVLQYEESKDFLVKLIEEKPYSDTITNSIRRMKNAYRAINDFLKELENAEKATLINFVRYFLVNVEMVVIQPDDIGSALKIFETINERGVGLNAMDLLKNLLFSNASPDDFNKIKDIWKDIVQNLHKSGEGDKPLRFLRYFLIARYHNGVIREEEIYKWIISTEGKSKIKYESNPVEFAKEILKASEKYVAFIKATSVWEADQDYPYITGIGYLSKKNSRQHIILLLALNDAFDKSAINLLAKSIEALAFYYAILKVLTKYYEATFAEWAVKIRELKTINDLDNFIQTEIGKEITKRQAAFDASFGIKTQWDIQPQYRIKYILGKIEDHIRSKVLFPRVGLMFYQNQQLEHILPQTGTNIPKDKYPEPYDYQNAVYKIGNLTLLEQPINGSLNFSNDMSSDDWFLAKAKAYKNSNILLTNTFTGNSIGQNTAYNNFVSENLLHFDKWDKEKVNERQGMLKKLMLNIWSA